MVFAWIVHMRTLHRQQNGQKKQTINDKKVFDAKTYYQQRKIPCVRKNTRDFFNKKSPVFSQEIFLICFGTLANAHFLSKQYKHCNCASHCK